MNPGALGQWEAGSSEVGWELGPRSVVTLFCVALGDPSQKSCRVWLCVCPVFMRVLRARQQGVHDSLATYVLSWAHVCTV